MSGESDAFEIERSCHIRWDFEAPKNVRVDLIDAASGAVIGSKSLPSRFYGNFGGAEVVVSDRGKYVAIYLFSGQSEHGYELFQTNPFEHVTSYFDQAEGAAPIFSPNEKYLAMENANVPCVSGDDDDCIVYSTIVFQDLDDETPPTTHRVLVKKRKSDTESSVSEWPSIKHLTFDQASKLVIHLPWQSSQQLQRPPDEDEEITVASTPPEGWPKKRTKA